MSRPLRLLASSTALAVAASLVTVTAAASASAAESPAPSAVSSDATEPPGRPARAGDGITVTREAASSRSFVRIAAPAAPRATTWPIGGGRATLSDTTVPAPTASAAQQLTSARMAHYRVYGGVMEGVVNLAAAPNPADPATLSAIFMRWGTVSGSTCSSPEGAGIAFTNTDTDTVDNPVYEGAKITVRPFRGFTPARTATWNCAFVDSRPVTDPGSALYDDLIGRADLFRQKPALSIRVFGRKLRPRGFTRVRVLIKNSSATVATAPRVRLRVVGRGVAVRYNPRVGTIRPGTGKRGAIFVKDTRPGVGYVTLFVRSKNYQRKLRVAVRPVRR